MNNFSFLFLKLFFSYLDVVAVCSASSIMDPVSNLPHFTMTKENKSKIDNKFILLVDIIFCSLFFVT